MSEIIYNAPMTPVIPMQDSDATIVQVEDLLKPVEEQTVPLHELKRANDRVEELRVRAADKVRQLENFKESVVGLFKEKVATGDLSRETANEWLEELGLGPIVCRWTVSGMYGWDEIVSIEVEAETEEEAIEKVKESIEVDTTVTGVKYEVTVYDEDGNPASGEASEDECDWADVVTDSLTDAFINSIEWSAEEA